jgi:Pretoxin HINT domain
LQECFAGASSFGGETAVLMADGTRRRIDEIRTGDSVLSFNPLTGERGPRSVSAVWAHSDSLFDFSTNSGKFTTTEDHRVWNVTDSEWEEIQSLDGGDLLLSADGQSVWAGSLDRASLRTGQAFNLSIEDLHTYFVVVGNTTILVHNTVCPISKAAAKTLENDTTALLNVRKAVGEKVGEQVYFRVQGTYKDANQVVKPFNIKVVVDHVTVDAAGQLKLFDSKFSRVSDLTSGSIISTLTPNQKLAYLAINGFPNTGLTSIEALGKQADKLGIVGSIPRALITGDVGIVARSPVTGLVTFRVLS